MIVVTMTALFLDALPVQSAAASPIAPASSPLRDQTGSGDGIDKVLEAAKAKAAKSGSRVSLPSRETETMKVWANPDGKTLRAELSTAPVQLEVADKDGTKSWKPVDTSIMIKSDGTLTAKRVKIPLTFGSKGDKALITAKDADGPASIGWSRELPAPIVDGNKITYRDAVSKGADLVITALPAGFTQDVVLRTRPEGAVKVILPITLPKGKSYRKTAGGQPQLMSAQGVAETAPLAAQAVDAAAAKAPEQGKVGTVGATVITNSFGRSSLELTPDASFLADASVTYPVTVSINSTWIGAGDSSDTFISSVQYPHSQTLATWMRAGLSDNGEMWRTYLRYVINGTDLDYARINNADLRLWNYQANACGVNVGAGILARRLTSPYQSSTLTWNHQPTNTATGQVLNKGGYSATLAGCSGSGELYFSIESIVQEWANGTPDYGLTLRAYTESGIAANWRQYRSDQYTGTDGRGPVLFIDYTPAPRQTLITTSPTKLAALPTYEEAYPQGKPQAAPNIVTSDSMSAAMQGQRWFAAPVDTSLLNTSATGGEDEADNTAPSISTVSPSPGATNVATGTTVSATFSEEVNSASILLKAADGTTVPGTTAQAGTGTTVTFTPSAPLASGAQYTATISGAEDIWNNTLGDYMWAFTTAADCPPVQTPDTTAPAIRAVSPAANAADASTGSPVSVTFCEPVTNAVLTLKNSSGTAVAGVVTMDQTSTTITFTPSSALAFEAQYTAAASGAADAAGNVMATYSWSFTAAKAPDTISPAVTATTPETGAINVAPTIVLRVTYSEPVTGAQIVVTSNTGATIAGILAMAERTVATFTPSTPLSAGATYTATASGATDLAGNSQSLHTWSFTTTTPLPPSRLAPKDAKAKRKKSEKPLTPSSGNGVPTTAAFDPQHMKLEDCIATPPLGADYPARIQERPYSSCWSSQIYIQDFIWDEGNKRWKRKPKPRGGWLSTALETISELATEDLGLEFRATYVMHSYLGNSTGTGVEGGTGTALLPQNFKVFTRLDDFAIRTGAGGEYRAASNQIPLKLDVITSASTGSTCVVQESTAQEKTIAAWRQDSDDQFLLKANAERISTCKYAPMITRVGGMDARMGLWTDWVVGSRGEKTGIFRGGFGTGSDSTFIPQVRCDWVKFSGNEPHTGACINPIANRLFTMSKSKDSGFLQVIDHIEDALKQDGSANDNRTTVPPLRDGETQVPPVKGNLGNEKTKVIPGNWNAPEGRDPGVIEAGDPLVRGPEGSSRTNRRVFSPPGGLVVNGVYYSNYCKYYFPERYKDPEKSKLDPDGRIQCDEYPFASTKQGAAAANGNYSIRAVGARHNTGSGSHGQALTNFYARYRVGQDNPFWVNIVP